MPLADSRLVRSLLAWEFEEMRNVARLSRAEAARDIGVSSGETVRKWETGENQPHQHSLTTIFDTYRAPDSTRHYVRMLYNHRDDGDLSTSKFEIRPLLRAASSYQSVLTYDPQFVVGFLQLEEYHFSPEMQDERYDDATYQDAWQMKASRYKEIVRRGNNIQVVAVLGEAAMISLSRMACRDLQLSRLKEAQSRGWDIRVVPIPHPYMFMGYEIFLPAEEDTAPPFVYSEPDGSTYKEHPDEVADKLDMFNRVSRLAKPLEEYLNAK